MHLGRDAGIKRPCRQSHVSEPRLYPEQRCLLIYANPCCVRLSLITATPNSVDTKHEKSTRIGTRKTLPIRIADNDRADHICFIPPQARHSWSNEVNQRVIRINQLANRPGKPGVIDASPATLWRWVREGRFPAPFKLGPGVTVWSVSDVEQFISQRRGAKS
jgi:predicted DNA-binding transcriptional regulator AlpA